MNEKINITPIKEQLNYLVSPLIVIIIFLSLLLLQSYIQHHPFFSFLEKMISGVYVPNHNFYRIKPFNHLNVNELIYTTAFFSYSFYYILRLIIAKKIPEFKPNRQSLLSISLSLLLLSVTLQTLNHFNFFSKEFRVLWGKTTDQKYKEFFYFPENYKFAKFCQEHIPRSVTVRLITDWGDPTVPNSIGKRVSFRYFVYPIEIYARRQNPDMLIIITSDRNPQRYLPADYEIIAQYDANRLIAAQKEPE